MMKIFYSFLRKSFFDVRFWILILFLIRLENINLPPLDEHNWRQSITLGVARNYVEWDANLFHPRTVICDSRTGIQAQEFPLFNYLISILWRVFGQQNWCFRLLNLIVSSFGLYYFSRVISRLSNDKAALAATVIFGTSVAFMYARKATPDVFAVSLVIMGIYYGWRYMETLQRKYLFGFGVWISLGILCKMPAAVLMGFITWPFISSEWSWKHKRILALSGILAVIPPLLWYFVWAPWAKETYGFPLYFPTGLAEGYQQLMQYLDGTLSRFYPIALTSNLGFILCVVGFLVAIDRKNNKILFTLATGVVIQVFFMLKTGMVFSGHAYYVIPFVPAMAMLAGYGADEVLKKRWVFIAIVAIIATEAVAKHKYDFFVPMVDRKYQKLEAIADQYIPRDARILINSRNGCPVGLYSAHRKGWTVDDRMKDAEWVLGESTVGLHYMIIERSRWNEPLPFQLLFEDEDFRIYKVKKDN